MSGKWRRHSIVSSGGGLEGVYTVEVFAMIGNENEKVCMVDNEWVFGCLRPV